MKTVFNFHGVPASGFRPWLAIICEAVTFMFANPDKAEMEAEQLRVEIEKRAKNRVREELRENNVDDYKHQKARLRMKWDRVALKQLKDALGPHAYSSGALSSAMRSVTATIQLAMDELDKAYQAAPPLDDEKNEVPVEMPTIPDAPSADYSSIEQSQDAMGRLLT